MTPERFQQIEQLYHAARDKSAEERAALLAEADPELRREVESLLAQRTGGEFLDRPAIENAPQLLGDPTVTGLTAGACPGPYRIERKLGEGGMRFLARATSGNPQGNLIRLPATDAPGFIPWNYATNVKRISQALDATGLPELADAAASIGGKLAGFASKFSKVAGAFGAAWSAGNVIQNTAACYNKN